MVSNGDFYSDSELTDHTQQSISLPAFSHDRMIIHRTIAVSIIKAYIISQVQCIDNPLFQNPSETIEQFIPAKLLRSATGSGKIWMATTP